MYKKKEKTSHIFNKHASHHSCILLCLNIHSCQAMTYWLSWSFLVSIYNGNKILILRSSGFTLYLSVSIVMNISKDIFLCFGFHFNLNYMLYSRAQTRQV